MALSDTNLVVRYYFDQAASGTGETQVNDVSGNAYHLTEVNYGSGNMAWTEVSGNRGLESTSITGTQRALRPINNTSDALRDALAGTQKVTIELVVDITTGNDNNGRIFVINNRLGGNPILGIAHRATQKASVYWEESDVTDSYAINLLTQGKCVVHIVYDTTQASQAARCGIYINGVDQAVNAGVITIDDTLALPSDIDLTVFNRENSGGWDRSVAGKVFYAAIYDDAFTGARIADHYDVLTADDDEPAAPPAGGDDWPLSGRWVIRYLRLLRGKTLLNI